MDEFLKIAPNGQWTLLEKANPQKPPKDDYTPGNQPYKAYRSTVGQLREDDGTKGSLKNFNGGRRPKQVSIKNKVKPSQESQSFYNDTHPGIGD